MQAKNIHLLGGVYEKYTPPIEKLRRSATAGTQAPPAFTPEQEVWIQQMISAHVDTRGRDDLPASNEDGDPNPTNSDPTGSTNTAVGALVSTKGGTIVRVEIYWKV